jgi:hypothetical protein
MEMDEEGLLRKLAEIESGPGGATAGKADSDELHGLAGFFSAEVRAAFDRVKLQLAVLDDTVGLDNTEDGRGVRVDGVPNIHDVGDTHAALDYGLPQFATWTTAYILKDLQRGKPSVQSFVVVAEQAPNRSSSARA